MTIKRIQERTLTDISLAVSHARRKHSTFVDTEKEFWDVLNEEIQELDRAVRYEGKERTRAEALDIIAVLVRRIEGDMTNAD